MPFFRFLAFFCCVLLLAACGRAEPRTAVLQGKTMGTAYTVKYLAESDLNLPDDAAVQAQLDALLEEVGRQMSTYREDSEISMFNRRSAAEGAMTVSADFAAVAAEAQRLNRLTLGGLDVTVGPVVNLWGFGPDKNPIRIPIDAELAEADAWTGWDKIRLHPQGQDGSAQLEKRHDRVSLDLSAIAKGFAVDKLAQHLDSLGVRHYLVEIGGELRGKGRNARGIPWRVGIERPQPAQGGAAQIVVALDNRALATSGDYRNFRTAADGSRLSHIIDPKTRRPISHNLASVSVVADSAMTADGLATGLFVLGAEQALAVAEQNGLAVFLIVQDGGSLETRMSSAFRALSD